jgi:hypothetical protein
MGEKLYHGTCRAFVQLAQERGGQFGPDYDRMSFTSDYDHAQMFADSWQTPGGIRRLQEMFGNLPREYSDPIILEFDLDELGKLERRLDGTAVELFIERGPVKLPCYFLLT